MVKPQLRLTYNNILTLAINPVDPSAVCRAVGGLFKSTDGGGSWHQPAAAPATTFHLFGNRSTNPAILYLGGYGSGVYKTTDARGDLASINTDCKAWTVVSLKVDPSNPQTV